MTCGETFTAETFTAVLYSVAFPGRETVRRGGFATAADAAAWAAAAFPGRPAAVLPG